MNPTRRDALSGMLAAAGLTVAPAAKVKADAGLTPQDKAYAARMAELDAWRPALTPQELRDHEYEYRLVLAAVLEVGGALAEAAKLHPTDCDCELCCEIAGLEYHFCFYEASLMGEILGGEEEAQALADRRRREGPPDPVWRVGLALERVQEATQEVLDRHEARGCGWENPLHEDCWGMRYAAGVWSDLWDCTAPKYLTAESKARRLEQLLADHEADKLDRLTGD